MRDIPHDVMQTAYQMVAANDFKPGKRRDLVVLIVAQGIAGERERAVSHLRHAATELRRVSNGDAVRLSLAFAEIINSTWAAIETGKEAA